MNVLRDAHNTIHVMDQAERDLAKAKAEDAREEATLKLQLNRWDRERREAEAKAQHEAWQRGQAAPIAPKPASAAAPTQAQQEAEAISTFEWQQLIKELLNGCVRRICRRLLETSCRGSERPAQPEAPHCGNGVAGTPSK